MKGAEFYYQKFESLLERWNKSSAKEFRDYANTHTPNYVYLWLEGKRKEDGFPAEIISVMEDFFGEMR
jgi:hypothetical protein